MPTRACFFALVLLGCATVYAPTPPLHDAGPADAFVCTDCPDMGPIVLRRDAGTDTGPAVDASVDATVDAAESDGGAPLAVAIDGVLTDTRWGDEVPLLLAVSPLDPYGGDHLDRFFGFRDATHLYLAFEGGLVSGDAVVVYADVGTTGFDVSLMGLGLGDTSGAVDATLSIALFGSASFLPDFGWGVSTMPHSASSGADTIGWRALASAGAFTLLTTGSRSACTTTACETAFLLTTIRSTPSSTLNLVVRLGRRGVGWSNQTFPIGQSSAPEYIDFGFGVSPAP